MNTLQFFTDQNCFGACDALDVLHRPAEADLFELQMFLVDVGNGQAAWCGRLQNVNGGEMHYFKGWSGLVANLEGILTPVAQMEVLRALLPLDDAAYGGLEYVLKTNIFSNSRPT